MHKFKPDLCWVLLQRREVGDLTSLFSITAFYIAMVYVHINEPWLIASPPIYYVWNHTQKVTINIYVYVATYAHLSY